MANQSSYSVLDRGFIRVVGSMGSDADICAAARVSTGGRVVTDSEKNRRLISYLIRHDHWSPFEMATIKLHIKAPVFVMRQWMRHKSWAFNERSGRYTGPSPDIFKTQEDAWRIQGKNNKQSSGADVVDPVRGGDLSHSQESSHTAAVRDYKDRISYGACRELSRTDLPLGLYTEVYALASVRSVLHFLQQRMHPSAQLEIREYASIIGDHILSDLFPDTWSAYKFHVMKSVRFSHGEVRILKRMLQRAEEAGIVVEGYLLDSDFKNKIRKVMAA